MAHAADGDTVHVHYTGRLDDGNVFDSSRGGRPLGFTLGEGRVIPGFEAAVRGMTVGETKTTVIPVEDAYGPRDEELLLEVPRSEMPDGFDPEVGGHLQMTTQGGEAVPVRIHEVKDDVVILDANHPLAGQRLTFELERVAG
jgi:peptidylprolyl isomerase